MTANERILVADDEKPLRESLTSVLRNNGYDVSSASDGAVAEQCLREQDIDIALIDIRMPKKGGMELLDERSDICPDTQFIMVTAFGDVEDAVEAIKLGASDYVAKPLVFDDILLKIERLLQFRRLADENRFLHTELGECYSVEGIVGESNALREVISKVERLAESRTSALIEGESGVGKELVARAIHYGGITRDGRFVPVNCAALPDSLVESELFGHKEGAFSGATRDKPGQFKVADGGTIFLDEIACMPLSTQPKILRAIEEKRIVPVGGTEPVEANARVLCATKENLRQKVEEGEFREDLFYRLNVVEIEVPPLRERREDIPPLADHFVNKFNKELNTACPGITDEAMERMLSYEWPGNVRELKNVIERALIFADGQPLQVDDLPFTGSERKYESEVNGDGLKSAVQAFEKQHIQNALERNGFDKKATARELDIGLSSLYRKIKELGIPDAVKSDGAS